VFLAYKESKYVERMKRERIAGETGRRGRGGGLEGEKKKGGGRRERKGRKRERDRRLKETGYICGFLCCFHLLTYVCMGFGAIAEDKDKKFYTYS